MIRLFLGFLVFLFLVRTIQLVWRISQRSHKPDKRTPEFTNIEEAHFEDITDLPDSEEKTSPKE